jgi:dimethylargininase
MTGGSSAGLAFTREVPESIVRCELTHVPAEPIDVARARGEHALYEGVLAACGFAVRRLPPAPDHPDSVFVEDTAVVLDEVAVMTRPGAPSRRGEVRSVRPALAPFRPLRSIDAPGTLDGGDVLVLDREVVIGISGRTNAAGAAQFASMVAPLGYRVRTLAVTACLHLKSAVTRAGERTLVLNPTWIDAACFPDWDIIRTDPGEPFAANVLWMGDVTVAAAAFPRTADRLRERGLRVNPVPAFELARAEGGLTCCSLLVRGAAPDSSG